MSVLTKKNIVTTGCVICSALLLAFVTNTFIQSAGLLAGGFMGIAILVNRVGTLLHVNIPISVVLSMINIPVAVFCAKRISRRFVFFSILQVLLTSLLIQLLPARPVFDDDILNIVFGGVLNGLAIAIALRGNASTGGTDFIALYVANRTGREIWMQVFVFNCVLLVIFGYLFGFDKAGYSILFQFCSTRTISTFHSRYKRISLEIFTQKPDAVLAAYLQHFMHGITAIHAQGGYSHQDTSLLIAIISSYELPEAVEALKEADPSILINVTKSEQFIGKFYQDAM